MLVSLWFWRSRSLWELYLRGGSPEFPCLFLFFWPTVLNRRSFPVLTGVLKATPSSQALHRTCPRSCQLSSRSWRQLPSCHLLVSRAPYHLSQNAWALGMALLCPKPAMFPHVLCSGYTLNVLLFSPTQGLCNASHSCFCIKWTSSFPHVITLLIIRGLL